MSDDTLKRTRVADGLWTAPLPDDDQDADPFEPSPLYTANAKDDSMSDPKRDDFLELVRLGLSVLSRECMDSRIAFKAVIQVYALAKAYPNIDDPVDTAEQFLAEHWYDVVSALGRQLYADAVEAATSDAVLILPDTGPWVM